MAAGEAPGPEAGDAAESASAPGPFVINLCSSTTPMALSHPEAPELKRFSFFVSRRREDNRERFRLHMGYFASLAEAEEWLAVVRDIYPGAWAGEAPGKKLRARAAAAELAKQLPPPPTAANARAVGVTAQLSGRPAAPPPPPNVVVPTLQAAPVAQAAKTSTTSVLMQPVLATAPAPTTPPAQARVARPPAASAADVAAPARTPVNAAPPVPGKQPGSVAPAASGGARPVAATPAGKRAPVPDILSGSNVREVMAALDETGGDTRQMQAPAARPAAPTVSAPSAARAAPGVRAQRPAAAGARAPAAEPVRTQAPVQPSARPAADASLSDTQVLRILENRRTDTPGGNDAASSGISLLRPDDTQTLQALKEAVRDNAPVAFAVQLYWSVQPVELDKVPPLAIFSAYTLYTVEGSREGRKWYGLRLGFFSDAISAKQVAYYVRSEFNSVAVVPVSPQEKARATAEENKSAVSPMPKKKAPEPRVDEFKLFDDEPAAPPPPAPAARPPEKPAARTTPKKKPLGRVRAREQRSPKTLEETLEILGASELEIDTGVEVLNDTGVRHLRVEVQKDTPFAKLLDRLTERVRRN